MKTLLSIFVGATCAASVSAQAADTLVRDAFAVARPEAHVPQLRYESAFATYPYGGELRVGAWREKNDLVHRLGGWAAFARGRVPDDGEPARPSAQNADTSKPQAGMEGHGSHGKR